MKNSIIEKALFHINKKKIISSYGICDLEKCILKNTNKYIDSKLKKVIIMLFPYFNDNKKGNLAKFCRSYDYHKIILKKLNNICQYLKTIFNNNIFLAYVDSTFVNEVKAAYISGAGCLGNNGLIIDEKYGPFVFIGEIVTDLDLNNTNNMKICNQCNCCLKECPVDLKKNICISKINQTKGILNNFEKSLILNSGYILGCDICINACDKINNFEKIIYVSFNDLIRNIQLNDIKSLTNKEFNEKYINRSFTWKGKAILERNLSLLL